MRRDGDGGAPVYGAFALLAFALARPFR